MDFFRERKKRGGLADRGEERREGEGGVQGGGRRDGILLSSANFVKKERAVHHTRLSLSIWLASRAAICFLVNRP